MADVSVTEQLRPHRLWTDAYSMTRAAHHEAGHGVAAIVCGIPLRHVSVQPLWGPSALGVVVLAVKFGTVEGEALLQMLLAGGSAERRWSPGLRSDELWDSSDMKNVETLIASEIALADLKCSGRFHQVPHDDPRVATAVASWRARADGLVSAHWGWISRTARALEQQHRLDAGQIEALRYV